MVTHYIIPSNQIGSLRIALVADLHNRPCDALLEALCEERPDMIAIAGDLMERYESDDGEYNALEDLEEQTTNDPRWKKRIYRNLYHLDVLYGRVFKTKREDAAENQNAYAFLKAANRIAPTFYALGNHERLVNDEDRALIAATGTILLENTCTTASIAGWNLAIGGLSSRGLNRDTKWLTDFCDQELIHARPSLKILLCHHPEYYPRLKAAGFQMEAIQLILAGHAHGGQMRLFGKPLFAPGQGFFPKLAGGIYEERMIVSRGLSDTAHTPRINNPMELVMIDVGKRRDEAENNNGQII